MAEMTYASRGLAGSALGIAIGGLATGLLNGGLGNILGTVAPKQSNCNNDMAIASLIGSLGGWNTYRNCHENMPVNRYEAAQSARIAELETEVKLRDANSYTNGLLNNFRNYVDAKFASVEKEICDQKTYNAVNTATLNCISGQVAQLMSLTKMVIPIASICPTPAVATTTTTP